MHRIQYINLRSSEICSRFHLSFATTSTRYIHVLFQYVVHNLFHLEMVEYKTFDWKKIPAVYIFIVAILFTYKIHK